MTTLQDQLQTATLTKECKVDLMTHVEQLELQSSTLPKRALTVADRGLPTAVSATTVSTQLRADSQRTNGTAAVERFQAEKSAHEATQRSVMAASTRKGNTSQSHSKTYNTSYHDCPTEHNPFVESRDRTVLSGKDECFVRQYAAALTKADVPREPKTDEASLAATEAYIKAFRKYTGREPTAKELEEVDRLNFTFDENGTIGVTQKPHSCHPHSHITSCSRRCVKCESQIYRPEVPAVRGARDRFPGPVPVWTSTKNLSTMVAGDMHEAGHQRMASTRKEAVNTVVGPK